MKTVYKKILPKYYDAVERGDKSFELRKDEDDIQTGDLLVLQEYDATTKTYTGKSITKMVTYVLRNVPEYGLNEGYCIISFK